MIISKAVIPVAGFGTRFLPITKTVPKELLPVVNKPVLQYIINEASLAGINEFIFVISPEKEIIKEYFKPYPKLEKKLAEKQKLKELEEIKNITKGLKFHYVMQKEPLGTGHALLQAYKFVKNDNFAYFDGDAIYDSKVPVIKQVIDIFNKYQADGAIGGTVVDRCNVTRYGNLVVDKIAGREYKLNGVMEKPSLEDAPKDNLVIGGQRYVFSPKIFKYLKTQAPGVGEEIWLADAADKLAKDGNFYACEIDGKYYDTGNVLEYLKTNIDFALKDPELKVELVKYIKSLG
ncbi:MAG: UTP-glucose-1-phosphate uridylyltransferase [uncultured bacterium]|nr:MAG: UTP-glucose-1-phosphate uridylyltransferase [uncultured bacterium]